MRIGIPRESKAGETLVAATAKTANQLQGLGYDIVVESGAGAHADQADEAFADAGVDPTVPYEVSDYRTAAGLVRHRLGVTLMPATEAARLDDLRVLPLEPAIMWNVHLATAGPQRSSAVARALAQAFVDDAERRSSTGT